MSRAIVIEDIGGSQNYDGKSRFRVIVESRERGQSVDEAINAPRRSGRTATRGEILELYKDRKLVYVLDPGSCGQNTDKPKEYTWWLVTATRDGEE